MSTDYRIAALATTAALLVGLWVWEPVAAGVWHDDGAYLLLARSLAEGEGLGYAGVPDSPVGAKFPPLYPALLAPGWLVAPGAFEGGAGGALLNVLLLALAAGVACLSARKGFGLEPGISLIALLPWLSPDLWRLGMVSLSEPLFVLLLVASTGWGGYLLRAGGGAGGRRGRGAWVVWGVILGLLSLSRTIGVVVAGAGVLALAFQGRRREATGVAGIVGLILGPWVIWSGLQAATLAEPLRELMGPYGRWLAGQYLADPIGAFSRAVGATPLLATIGGSLLLPGLSGKAALGAGVIAAAMLFRGLRRAGPEGIHLILVLGLYALVLWLWPHIERRLVAPVLPLVALGVALIARELGEWGARRGRRVAAILVMLWTVAFGALGLFALAGDRHLEAYRLRERMLARAVAAVQEAVPADGVVGAPEFWAGLHLYTGRPVAPSARFLPLSPRRAGTPFQQFELWDAVGIEYVVLEQGGRVHREAMDTLDARCPGAVQLLASWQGGVLVRLAWDRECRRRLGL